MIRVCLQTWTRIAISISFGVHVIWFDMRHSSGISKTPMFWVVLGPVWKAGAEEAERLLDEAQAQFPEAPILRVQCREVRWQANSTGPPKQIWFNFQDVVDLYLIVPKYPTFQSVLEFLYPQASAQELREMIIWLLGSPFFLSCECLTNPVAACC